VSLTPQNDSFIPLDDDGAQHGASGFICPTTVAGFKRGKLSVYDATEQGRDVSCGYDRDVATATLYLTKLPSQYTLSRVFETYVRQAQASTPSVGAEPNPYPQIPGESRRLGEFWRDKEGRGEGLWLTQIGPWFIKLRVTYHKDAPDHVRALAEAIFSAANAQIQRPTI
jgi:hypothetical protein